MSTATEDEGQWRLDRKIPITLLVAIVAQFALSTAMVMDIKSKGEENTRRIVELENQKIGERIVRVEVQVLETKALLLRMESKLDRINDYESKGHRQ